MDSFLKLKTFTLLFIQLGSLKGIKTRNTSNLQTINFWYSFKYGLYGYVNLTLLYRFLFLASFIWTNVLQKFTSKFLLILDPGVYSLFNHGYTAQTVLISNSLPGGISNHFSINSDTEMGLSSNLKNYKYTRYDLIGIFSSEFWITGNGGKNGEMFKKFSGIITSLLNSSDSNSWSKMDLFLTPVSNNITVFSFFYWKFFQYITYFQQFKYLRFQTFFNSLNDLLQSTKQKLNYLYNLNIKPKYQTKDFYKHNAQKFAKIQYLKENYYKQYHVPQLRLNRLRNITKNYSIFPKKTENPLILNFLNIKSNTFQKYGSLKVRRLTRKYFKYISFFSRVKNEPLDLKNNK